MATATDANGTQIELHTQEVMVPVMVLSNRQRQQEFLGTYSRGRYCAQPFLIRNKSLSTFILASVSPGSIYFKLESCSVNLYQAPDINPSDFNPILESYTCSLSAF